MMKAACYRMQGQGSEVIQLEEFPIPQPGPHEVLVQVHAHGVNPTDCKRRSGFRGPMKHEVTIPGFDAAGTISQLGSDVVGQRVNQRVWVWEAALGCWDGAAAEYVRVPASRAMLLPDSASMQLGASLGVPAFTAAHALRLGNTHPGDVVLITGGGGAVGNAAVALAKFMGCHVLATARSQEQQEDARLAGADHVVAPVAEEIARKIAEVTNGQGVQHMVDVDLGGHLEHAWSYVAENGSIASYGSASNPKPILDWAKYMYRNISIHGVAIFEVPEEDKLAAAKLVQQALEQKFFVERIAKTFPLEETGFAHDYQETGRPRGKVIVQVS